MTGDFWVYVNEPNDKAFVHLHECSFCNNGEGMTRDKLDSNGQWLGPFSREAAIVAARRAKKKNTAWCGFCARRLDIKNKTIGDIG
jgi:hypothetical protein